MSIDKDSVKERKMHYRIGAKCRAELNKKKKSYKMCKGFKARINNVIEA